MSPLPLIKHISMMQVSILSISICVIYDKLNFSITPTRGVMLDLLPSPPTLVEEYISVFENFYK